ncbi:MAG: hypothetical protein ACOY3O_09065, partial [Thermodesulfobacteriota bacterium]
GPGWPESIGMGGRLQMESVAGITWNGWPTSNGISGRLGLEYALCRRMFVIRRNVGHRPQIRLPCFWRNTLQTKMIDEVVLKFPCHDTSSIVLEAALIAAL